ncbi:hypothetical protein OIU76_019553 [Salix suchowensis]|nr:hypothetical protein OIU76_019553 [Salix suchowensis]
MRSKLSNRISGKNCTRGSLFRVNPGCHNIALLLNYKQHDERGSSTSDCHMTNRPVNLIFMYHLHAQAATKGRFIQPRKRAPSLSSRVYFSE